jgi:hypothetical protein
MKTNYLNTAAVFTKISIIWIALAILMLNLFSCKDEPEDLPNLIEEGITGSLLWKFTDDNVLTISGRGEMLNYGYDYDSDSNWINTPWYSYRDVIKTVVIDNGVTSIGDHAFEECLKLKSITIPNGVISIGDYAFWKCFKLTNISLPNSITSIGTCAFVNCFGLTSITIPNSVTSIGTCAFYNCYGLTDIIMSSNVTSVEEGTFFNCYGLISIIIPNGVKNIDGSAFNLCSSLKNITISNSVTNIGNLAFYGCPEVTEITVKATTPPAVFNSRSFYYVNRAIPVYVPQESLELYKNADVWKEFTNLQGKVF